MAARLLLAAPLFFAGLAAATGAETGTNQAVGITVARHLQDVLPPGRWLAVEQSVDHALAWIASQQAPDGSFPTQPVAQPAVTSLCVLAFLSRGHQPGHGPYGARMEKAVDFVLSCQKPDGLLSDQVPEAGFHVIHPTHTAFYNHAVAGLMLGEVYGSVTGPRAGQVKQAISKALELTFQFQRTPKQDPLDQGGWRYIRREALWAPESDLSATGWQLMFLRSARNAEFRVPQSYIDEALRYVRGCWEPRQGLFFYTLGGSMPQFKTSGRGMMGTGIVALCLGGQHQDPIALAAGDWLLAHPYQRFGDVTSSPRDRFFYSAYYCSQAMAQLGGRYWERFFPSLAEALLSGQSADGSWPPELGPHERGFGNAYSTALGVLSLTPPYQLLPVYQR
jgi:hypothetical protein